MGQRQVMDSPIQLKNARFGGCQPDFRKILRAGSSRGGGALLN
jgi:hypothetical protein